MYFESDKDHIYAHIKTDHKSQYRKMAIMALGFQRLTHSDLRPKPAKDSFSMPNPKVSVMSTKCDTSPFMLYTVLIWVGCNLLIFLSTTEILLVQTF